LFFALQNFLSALAGSLGVSGQSLAMLSAVGTDTVRDIFPIFPLFPIFPHPVFNDDFGAEKVTLVMDLHLFT